MRVDAIVVPPKKSKKPKRADKIVDIVPDDERKELTQTLFEIWKGFDRTVLSLSSLGLSLTIAFAQKLKTEQVSYAYPYLLLASSVLFIASIIAILASYTFGHLDVSKRLREQLHSKHVQRRTVVSNFCAMGALIGAIVTVFIFTAINFMTDNEDMSKQQQPKKPQIEQVQEGVTAPPRPAPKPSTQPPSPPSESQK